MLRFRGKVLLATASAILLLTSLLFLVNPFNNEAIASLPSRLRSKMHAKEDTSAYHLMLLDFKDDVPAAEITELSKMLFSLPDRSVHPALGKTYVRSVLGGRNPTPLTHEIGISYIFIVEFTSVQHKSYFVNNDPTHSEFQEAVSPLLHGRPLVADFVNGSLTPRHVEQALGWG